MKYFIGGLMVCLLLFSSCGTFQKGSTTSTQSSTSTTQKKLLKEAKSYLGTPYRYGGTNRRGIDCSALVMNSFQTIGVSLPRVTRDQAQEGKAVSLSRLKVGDVLFFNTSGSGISHAGIVERIQNGKVYFIHASSSKGVMVSSLDNPYWKPRFVKARRYL